MATQLDSLDRLRDVVAEHYEELLEGKLVEVNELYCSTCSGRRRMKLFEITMKGRDYGPRRRSLPADLANYGSGYDPSETPRDRNLKRLAERGMAPALFMLKCVQCEATFTAMVYIREGGEALALFPSRLGGLSTKNTPPPAAYYLDQASRSQAAGARSAAVAMYRVALEQVLEHEGYTQRMCGKKLEALEADVAGGRAPKWATEVDRDLMTILKDLGNGVLHTNGGDITLQENATPDLLEMIGLAFEELLDVVYERQFQAHARRSALKQVADKMKK